MLILQMHRVFILSFNSLSYIKVVKQAGSVGPGALCAWKRFTSAFVMLQTEKV